MQIKTPEIVAVSRVTAVMTQTATATLLAAADIKAVPQIPAVPTTLKKQKPTVTVAADGQLLSGKKSYSVKYKNNKNAGEASITIKLKKNYKSDKAAVQKENITFTILPVEVQDFMASYKLTNGGDIKAVKVQGKKVSKKFYKVNKQTGTIDFSGNYSGSVKYKTN